MLIASAVAFTSFLPEMSSCSTSPAQTRRRERAALEARPRRTPPIAEDSASRVGLLSREDRHRLSREPIHNTKSHRPRSDPPGRRGHFRAVLVAGTQPAGIEYVRLSKSNEITPAMGTGGTGGTGGPGGTGSGPPPMLCQYSRRSAFAIPAGVVASTHQSHDAHAYASSTYW